jgi:hypothetical protein
MGLQAGGHLTLAAGTGTFGYEPNVNYLFGFPKSIKPGGVAFHIPLVRINAVDDGNADRLKQFTLQTGLLSSALEHAVPEQMFVNDQNPGEAISAVKALQKANAQGQRIYHITAANQSAILANIHHDADTMAEIKNALNAGKEVITHTDAVSVPGWSGAGYIITDPVTGAGAFKIAGGGNGGFLEWLSSINLLAIFTMFLTISGGAIDGFIGSAASDLPLAQDLKNALIAKWFEPVGKWIGGISLLLDIGLTLGDEKLDVADKVGRISVALLSYYVGGIIGTAIGAAFLPGAAVGAAIAAVVFSVAFALVLNQFSEIYFSFLFERQKRRLMTLQA